MRFFTSASSICLLLVVATCNALAANNKSDVVTFRHDVMAVLSKAGCNSGACHGNLNGKGGLKLSLRGQDPDLDFMTLTREQLGRRINLAQPDESLLLLKPVGRVAHQGGVRFAADSVEYQTVRRWIAEGAAATASDTPQLQRLEISPQQATLIEPIATQKFQVSAFFSNGTSRDVTRQATYETSNLVAAVSADGEVSRQSFGEATILVRYLDQQLAVPIAFVPVRPNFVWHEPAAFNEVDRWIFRKLKTLRVAPSSVSDDTMFLRRLYQDLLGLPPSAEEARTFAADTSPDKRNRVIDRLLQRPEFNELWALRWSDLLRNEEKSLDPKGVEIFHRWLKQNVAASKPLDEMVRELIVGRGSTFENPAANFYRANRDPATRGETAARLFLGVRLQCAQCHNHPFDRWTQDDYYSWSALFARIDYEVGENKRKDKLDKNEFVGDQIVKVKDEGEFKNARTGADAAPAFLGAAEVPVDRNADRLQQLASWLTSPNNQRFAQSQVNWVWYHLMGRGLVEPIDDFRATNPPSHPELLNHLAADFAEHGFDLRHLVRKIVSSRAYQLSSEPNESNRDDDTNYSRAIVRRLRAEQLLDAQTFVLDAPAEFNGYPRGQRAGQIPGVRRVTEREKSPSSGDRFLSIFGKPARLMACECERSSETTLTQAFVLIGSQDLNARISQAGNRIDRLSKSQQSPAELVTELYWTALSRAPSPSEREAAVSQIIASKDPALILQDLAWALLNSKEFLFRR